MNTKNEKIKFFVDHSIESLKLKDLLWTSDPNVPDNMKNLEMEDKNNWFSWKAIESIINENELNELEKRIGLRYPLLYKEFLLYKHFYRVEKIKGVEFFSHKSNNWKSDLIKQYKMQEPEITIKKGFIPFGFLEGGKNVCFDTNDNLKIISIFYDTNLGIEPKIEILFSDFESMIDVYAMENKST